MIKLIVKDCDDKEFIIHLIKHIRMSIIKNYSYKKLKHIENYLHDSLNIELPIRTIIIYALNNLTYYKFLDNHFEISINHNLFLPGTNAKLIDICKLINYGNLEIAGSNIFTNSFNEIKDKIDTIYSVYLLIGV